MAEALSMQLDQPTTYEELSFFERLSLLVNSESTNRDNRKIARLLKQAKLRQTTGATGQDSTAYH